MSDTRFKNVRGLAVHHVDQALLSLRTAEELTGLLLDLEGEYHETVPSAEEAIDGIAVAFQELEVAASVLREMLMCRLCGGEAQARESALPPLELVEEAV
tara:strand:+ start:281 stop:580 length:300 start_codon:yes stop_codon:yes gene_type:complete